MVVIIQLYHSVAEAALEDWIFATPPSGMFGYIHAIPAPAISTTINGAHLAGDIADCDPPPLSTEIC